MSPAIARPPKLSMITESLLTVLSVTLLRDSLNLAMTLQRAIIRQGTSIIDKQDIRTTRNHRIVILAQGPDLALFSHPGVLGRLASWLVDALRDRMPGTAVGSSKKKGLPFVIACLDEGAEMYTVIGLMGALDFNQIRRKYVLYGCHSTTAYSCFSANSLILSSMLRDKLIWKQNMHLLRVIF